MANIVTPHSPDIAGKLIDSDQQLKDILIANKLTLEALVQAVNKNTAALSGLDVDYGMWTPVGADATSGGNLATAGTSIGHYTKIGNMVTLIWQLLLIDTTGLTAGNVFYIQGIPFPSVDDYPIGPVFPKYVNWAGSNSYLQAIILNDAIATFEPADNALGAYTLVSGLTSTSAKFNGSITYKTI